MLLHMIIMLIIILVIFKFTIIIVKQDEVVIIERLGRYHTTCTAGLSYIVPFIDRVRKRIKLGDQSNYLRVADILTKDRKKVDISITLIYEIIDPEKSVYEVDDLKTGLEYIIKTTLRAEISTMNYNDIFLQRNALLDSLKKQLSVSEEDWGFQIVNISIEDVNLKI